MRWVAWLTLVALASCASPGPAPLATSAPPKACRIGPDGGRPLADRGIGGTGAPLVQTADRGIGGTGIIGVITGFASVCVAGEEVALPEGVPLRIDEMPASLDELRAGQVAAMQAAGPAAALQAQQISVRHAAIGPVQAVGPGTMTVAGQLVTVKGAAGAATDAKPGDWVAVSGLPAAASTITATRIDPAPPGRVLVRGDLVRIGGTTRIGSLTVRLPDGLSLPGGWPVVVTGQLQRGILIVDSARPDVASESPAAYFGADVTSFIIEADVVGVAGGYLVDRDFIAGQGYAEQGARGRGIARFERGVGGLVATGLRLDPDVGNGNPGAGGFGPVPSFPGASHLPGSGIGGRLGAAGLGGSSLGRRGFDGGGFNTPNFGPLSGPPGIAGPAAPPSFGGGFPGRR